MFFIIFFSSISFLFSKFDEYVLLISFDGFRYDYDQRVDTPNFDYIEKI